jgi:phosphopantothenoylcysteine decarboxylase/phosphopantothenate--cysteine ligase
MFEQRCIVIGVTGGIAAFKAASLVSLFKKRGADVHVILTRNAAEFITPLTFETLSGNPAITDTFRRETPWEVEHIELAKKADLFIIAPATANFIGKAAAAIADDMLLTTLLAAKCPVIVAPAMNKGMLSDQIVQENLKSLQEKGFFVMGTGEGLLACGDIGEGRMKEPEEIIHYAGQVLEQCYDMAGIRVLITAGPTREHFDPVRFISSPSTGKMGYAIAQNAVHRGAEVTLVTGPVGLKPPEKARVINVISAQEMYEQVMKYFSLSDIVIKSAAVADYRPKTIFHQKIKKGENLTIELERTKDILKELGSCKSRQLLIGFAAETQNIEEYAKRKLIEKNLDMIAANDVSESGSGFAHDTNHIILFKKDGFSIDLKLLSKEETAKRILDETLTLYNNIKLK